MTAAGLCVTTNTPGVITQSGSTEHKRKFLLHSAHTVLHPHLLCEKLAKQEITSSLQFNRRSEKWFGKIDSLIEKKVPTVQYQHNTLDKLTPATTELI